MSDNSKISQIRPGQQVDVREVWPSEPKDFTPWLHDHLDLLEIIELGVLVPVDMEVSVGSRYLDVLARTSDGALVAIENQFSVSDHDHFTRGLAYAVGIEAKFLIVVAERHREEFREVATHLNHVSKDAPKRIGIFLVEFSVIKVEEFYIPSFSVVCAPAWGLSTTSTETIGQLVSLDDFYSQLEINSVEKVSEFKTIIDSFVRKPGCREDHNSKSTVSLVMVNPATGRDSCVIQLTTKGRIYLCRGYILELEPFESQETQKHLDEGIDSIFGEFVKTPKNYYPVVPNATSEQVGRFVELITSVFDRFKREGHPIHDS